MMPASLMARCVRHVTMAVLLCLATAATVQAEPPEPAPWWTGLPPRKSTTVYGQTIRYYDVGSGPTLVLLHGLGSNAGFDWGAVIPELAKHYRVLAPDQLGFGQSAKPAIAYGVTTWVDMLGGFLRDRDVQAFSLAGESLGGWIAGLYTVRASEAGWPVPARLILVDAGGHPSMKPSAGKTGGPASWPPLSIAGTRDGLARFVFHDPGKVTAQIAEQAFAMRLAEGTQFTQDSFRQSLGADASVFLDQAALARLDLPVLVVWGAQDRLVPPSNGADFATWIPHAQRVTIDQAGHAPAIEQPQRFLEATLPFLQGR